MINIEIRLIIFFATKVGKALQSQQKQDQELTGLVDQAQIMNRFCQIQTLTEESRENHYPFKYDLNQIPYDYTVEVRNLFPIVHRVPDELWTEVHDIEQETGRETIPKKK